MRTSAQWWTEVKADPAKFTDWLLRQYRGEVTASKRIMDVAEGATDPSARFVLRKIAADEARHASWVKDLLISRNIEVADDSENAERRYWAAVKPSIKDFVSAMAVGAHAEAMRLKRIEVIALDATAPDDVRKTFLKILADEQFHEQAFRALAGEKAMAEAKPSADEGKRLLGLEA